MNAPALFMALFNGAWQGALLCVAAFGVLKMFRRLNAATCHAIWTALLAIVIALPAANYVFSVRPVERVVTVTAPGFLAPVVKTANVSPSAFSERFAEMEAPAAQAAPAPSFSERAVAAATALGGYAKYALLALLLLGLIRFGFLVREIVRMMAARRSVRFIEPPFALHDSVRRPYAFAASPGFAMPCVLGFQPALIVIPEALLAEGDSKELLSVVLHEHEHVMRFDDIQNVLHRLAGAIGFFLPGVWIALRELAIYREQICDDAAIAGAGNRYAYARTLSAMAGWIDASSVPVPCFIFKRKQLLRRIEVLLDAAVSHSLRPNLRFAVTAVSMLGLIAMLVLRLQVPVFAERISVVDPVKPAIPAPPARIVVKKPVVDVVKIVKPAVAKPKLPAKPPKPAKIVKTVKTETRTVIESHNGVRTIHVYTVEGGSIPRLAPIAPVIIGPGEMWRVRTPRAMRAPHPWSWSTSTSSSWSTSSGSGVSAGVPFPRVAPIVVPHPGAVILEAKAATLARRGGGDLLDTLSRYGYTNLSVDELIALRDHGVSSALIAGAASYFGHPSASDLVRLADRGVSGSYLAELHSAGVQPLSVEDVIRLQDHGVSPMLIAGLRSRGYSFNAETLVKLADHGVSLQYIDAMQRIRSGGRPSLDDLIRLHDAGFTP